MGLGSSKETDGSPAFLGILEVDMILAHCCLLGLDQRALQRQKIPGLIFQAGAGWASTLVSLMKAGAGLDLFGEDAGLIGQSGMRSMDGGRKAVPTTTLSEAVLFFWLAFAFSNNVIPKGSSTGTRKWRN